MLKFLVFFILFNLTPALALVFYLTRNRDNFGIIDKLILSVIASPFILLFISFLEDVVRIPQVSAVLLTNATALALLNIFLLVRYFPGTSHYTPKFSAAKLAFYAAFLALLFFRVYPTRWLLTPLLHDPISHSEWLRFLNQTGHATNDQWYPQGLEYFLNYYAAFFNFSYPKIIAVSTNFFQALFPVAMFYLGLMFFRERKGAIIFPAIIFLLATILPIPKNFFFTAGKNSMIFAFTIAPFAMYLAYYARTRIEYFAGAALAFSLLVVHWPTGIFVVFIFYAVNLYKIFRKRGSGVAIDRQSLVNYLWSIGAAVAILAVFMVHILPIFMERAPADDKSISGLESVITTSGIKFFVTQNFYEFIVATLTLPVVLALFAAIPAFLLAGSRKPATVSVGEAAPARVEASPLPEADDSRGFVISIIACYAALFLGGIVLLLPKDKSYGIFYNIELRFFLLFIVLLTVAWLVYVILDRLRLINRSAVLSLGVLVLILLSFSYYGIKDYRNYQANRKTLETTVAEDVTAFDFISNNINDGKRFLIQQGEGGNIVMGADSGVWIPSFTGRSVDVDFVEYFAPQAPDIYRLYIDIAKNPDDRHAIEQLYCQYNIGYVFFGSRRIFSDNMQKATLDGSENFERIYNEGDSIYRIKPVSCGPV